MWTFMTIEPVNTSPQAQSRKVVPSDSIVSEDRRIWRGILAGLLLVPVNTLWVLSMEHIASAAPIPSTISLFFNVVFILFVIALINRILERLRPSLALNRGELVIVYVMLTLSTALAGLDGMQVLVPVITHGYWFATPENHWREILANAPSWLVVSDTRLLAWYYTGGSTLYQGEVLHAWLSPVMWWSAFIVVWVFVMLCLSVLVRQQWADRERLSFPIIQLPLALTTTRTPLWSNRLLWIGFAIAGGIDLLNGLHYLFPAVPYLSISPTLENFSANNIMQYVKDPPWSGIGWLPVTFYPAVIGMAFLVPTDLLFSCVVFFFCWKMFYVIGLATGISNGYADWMNPKVFPWGTDQMLGGYLAITLAPIITARRYFRQVGRRILGHPSEVSDAGEGMKYRTAALGVLLGIGLLVWFSVIGGLSPSLAIIFFLLYYTVAISVARVRGQFGSPVHDFHGAGPSQIITHLAGTSTLGTQNLTMLSLLWWFNRAYRQHPIGNTIEGMQMAVLAERRSSSFSHASGRLPRAVVIASILAVALAAITFFWGWLHYAYSQGVSTWKDGDGRGTEMITNLASWIQNPEQARPQALLPIAAGFTITMLLSIARTNFMNWPLHPVAYVVASNWSIHLVWMPMLIAWLLKIFMLRYGGLRLYRQALPFMYGLILGESIIGCGWTLIRLVFHVKTYSFWGL